MNYRKNTHLKSLIWVEANINQVENTGTEYKAKTKTNYKNKTTTKNVVIYILIPNDLDDHL